MTRVQREVFFLNAPRGGRFCLLSRPQGRPLGGILYLHPFAEELNKSRRMAALGACAFAERGWLVLQVDLFGCGDSAGDFGDATWRHWLDDVTLGWEWLRTHCDAPLALWSLRGGSLLASQWLEQSTERVPVLMWQPVTTGRQHLTQFLRLKAANEMLDDVGAKAVMTRLREDLRAGKGVEIAGYTLSSELARALDEATVRLPPGYSAPVALLEVGNAERVDLSPALAAVAGQLRGAGVPVMSTPVVGPAFWQTQEIETAPALIDVSLRALERFVS